MQLGRWRLRLLHQRNHVCRQVFRTERCARERLRLALHSPASGKRRKPATLLDDASQSAGSVWPNQSQERNRHCRTQRTAQGARTVGASDGLQRTSAMQIKDGADVLCSLEREHR